MKRSRSIFIVSIVMSILSLCLSGCTDSGTGSGGDIVFSAAEGYDKIDWDLSNESEAVRHDMVDDIIFDDSDTDYYDETSLDLSSYDDTSDTVSSYVSVSSSSTDYNDKSSSSADSSSKSSQNPTNQYSFDQSATTMRERLSGTDAEIYDALVKAFSNYELKIVLDGKVESDKLDYIYRCISDDHPEFFWVPYGYRGGYYMVQTENNTLVQYDSLGDMSKEDIPKYKEKFDKCVDEIMETVPDDVSDYEKILYIHDYLVKNCEYNNDSETGYSAYGCIVEKKAVCSGYTPAFQLLLHKIGIECGNVIGFATRNAEAHTWNYVKYGGDYYWTDVTWDDPVFDSGSYEGTADISHSYFFITTEQLERTHAISTKESPFIPDCSSTKYSYMKMTGNYLEKYSFDEFNKLADNSDGHVCVQFADRQGYVDAVQDLFFDKNAMETDYFYSNDCSGMSYLLDQEMQIIEVYYE